MTQQHNRTSRRRSIVSEGSEITVIRKCLAGKRHVCADCGGPIGEGTFYNREETIDATKYRLKTTPEQRQDFWRAWGRIPHGEKEVAVFHASESECIEWETADEHG